jgi:2-hydroxy-6-oxonona-2,4-dienedioate hydrolase
MAEKTAKFDRKGRMGKYGQAHGNAQSILVNLGIILLLAFTGIPAHAQAASNGAVDGLVPKFIDAGGVRTRYYEMGKGAPLVLIHGGGGNSPNNANIWSKNIRALAEHFRVIAPDRLGCGMTAGTYEQSVNYQDQVDWLYNFLNAMHLKQVNLVGHSAGGAVVFFFAVEHPEMIKTLAVGSAGPETPGLRSRQSRMMGVLVKTCPTKPLFAAQKCRIALLSNDPQRVFDSKFWAAQESMKKWRDEHYKMPGSSPLTLGHPSAQFMNLLHSSWAKARNGVLDHKPVLIFYGKQDPFDWAANAKTADLKGAMGMFDVLGAKDPNVQLFVLNDAGHFVFRDQPSEFDADLTQFVDYWEHHTAR